MNIQETRDQASWLYLDNLDDPASELGEAEYGIPQEDLRSYVGSLYGNVGFQFVWDTPKVTPGRHTLYVLAEGKAGWYYNPVPINVGLSGPAQVGSEGMRRQAVRVEQDHWPDERDAGIARLRELVASYERGRFNRFMKWLHSLLRFQACAS